MTRRSTALSVAAVLTLAACTGGATTSSGPADGSAVAADVPAGCEPVEHPALQVGQHLIGDAEPPGTYSSTPPTSGWHTTSVPDPGRAATDLRDPEIVSALENGIVVAAVAPDVLDDTDEDVLDALVAQFPDRLLVTPYEADVPASVALLTWGGLQRCDRLDPAAVTSFVLAERVAPQDH